MFNIVIVDDVVTRQVVAQHQALHHPKHVVLFTLGASTIACCSIQGTIDVGSCVRTPIESTLDYRFELDGHSSSAIDIHSAPLRCP